MVSVSDLCRETKNYFCRYKIFGEFDIKDGTLEVDDALDGQYIRIIGSSLNDGLYKYPVEGLTDESFDGVVWVCSIPKDFVGLVDEINKWTEKSADVLDSPYKSESFGGYSYTKDDGAVSWQKKFSNKLNAWRKIL